MDAHLRYFQQVCIVIYDIIQIWTEFMLLSAYILDQREYNFVLMPVLKILSLVGISAVTGAGTFHY